MKIKTDDIIEIPQWESVPALPDRSQDPEAWRIIQSILDPSSIEIDENLLCPITYTLLKDPVMTVDGQTYERKAIEQWFVNHNTSPLTNEPLENKTLFPNYFAKNQVSAFLEKNRGLELKGSTEEIERSLIDDLVNTSIGGEQKSIQDLVSREPRLLVQSFKAFKLGETALHFAIYYPKALDAIVELLESRYKGLALAGLLRKDSKGWLPIHKLVRHLKTGYGNVLTLLKVSIWMGQKISLVSVPPEWTHYVDNHGLNEALAWSVAHGLLEITRCFLRLGANPHAKTVKGETRVYQAVKKGRYDCLIALLEAKADPNSDDKRLNDTPLHYAVKCGATKVPAALVRAGAHIDKALKNGRTPLHIAASETSIDILEVLLNGRRKLPQKLLEAKDNQGFTALHLAVIYNMVDNVAWLLNHNANPFSVNSSGNTALHEAVQIGAAKIIKLLLKAGASNKVKNKEGLSPRQLAEKNLQHDVVKILETKQNPFEEVIVKQQEIIHQQEAKLEEQKREIEKLRLFIEKINQASSQQLSEIKSLVQNDSKLDLDNKKLLPEPYLQQCFFTPISPNVKAVATSANLDSSYVQQCYNSRQDGRFGRIEKLAVYIGNYVSNRFPQLTLAEALNLTLQEAENLKRCYPLIADNFIKISEARNLTDRQSHNLCGFHISIVREGLLPIEEVMNLSKSDVDFLENAVEKYSWDLAKCVAALKEHRAVISNFNPR